MQHDKREESWLITAATWITIIIVVLEAMLQVVEQFTDKTDGVAEQENERGEEQQNKEVTNI